MKIIFLLILTVIALNADNKFLCSSINDNTRIKIVCYKYKLFYKSKTLFTSTNNRCRCVFKKKGDKTEWTPKVLCISK